MGDAVREEVRRRGLPEYDEVVGRVANELRMREGMDAIAKRCLPRVKDVLKRHELVVVDGVRGIAEVELFRKEFSDSFFLVYIDATFSDRLERIRKRERPDRIFTDEELRNRDEREKKWGLEDAINSADFMIENKSSLQEFKNKVKDFFI
jgi:dephospho-CoA kinase